MTSENTFLKAYDLFVNEIFSYFLSKTAERNAAKSLTQETFKKTWQQMSHGLIHDGSMRQLHAVLKVNASSLIHSGRLIPVMQ